MGATSIEWTATRGPDGTMIPGYTFNPWWGCQRVSPACEHCYAETLAKRVGHGARLPTIWGPRTTERKIFGDAHWREPLTWNAAAAKDGVRRKVFCASMADVFEDRPDLDEPRARLRRLIDETPALDWLLLTKRPQNADRLMRMASLAAGAWTRDLAPWPANVWLGTTVEDQRRANERIPELLRVPARVRFLSCEPLLESVDLNVAAYGEGYPHLPLDVQARQIGPGWKGGFHPLKAIDWVIVGGETGAGARPMHPAWARAIRDQCVAAGVAFHFKQWGEWAPRVDESKLLRDGQHVERKAHKWMNANGSTGLCWLSSAESPWLNWTDGTEGLGDPDDTVQVFSRVRKERAGRLLDGRTWDECPDTTR